MPALSELSAKIFDLYETDKIKLPPFKKDDLADLPNKKFRSLEAVDDAIHGYLACISYADAMIGRVLDALEASPHADNTLVVLWSDHGYHHGERGANTHFGSAPLMYPSSGPAPA